MPGALRCALVGRVADPETLSWQAFPGLPQCGGGYVPSHEGDIPGP